MLPAKEFVLQYFVEILAFISILYLTTLYFVFSTYRKLQKFTKGSDSKSLEDKIIQILQDNKDIISDLDKIKNILSKLIKSDNSSFKYVASEKYVADNSPDSFNKQSFSLAVANKNGDGFLISSITLRGETFFYIKDIQDFTAKALSDEELAVIEKIKRQAGLVR